MNTLTIDHPTGQYNVYVGYDLLSQLKTLVPLRGSVALITDDKVGPLYGDYAAAQLDRPSTIITVPTGEQHKNLTTVRQIYDEMFAAGCDRKSTVLALGGGVINDMGGFAAASFMRGIDFATCPTTLLAMVDASVGGKTGVDMPQGKNLVGAFKQPIVVLADLSTLKTLPRDEFAAGMAEVIKHGLLGNPSLFRQTQEMDWYAEMLAQNQALLDMVTAAIRVKQDVVQEDPFEGGRRALLNLGHTFGHAIEQVSHYRVKHGEAVGMGLVCAARLSVRLGHASSDLQTEIEQALENNHLFARIPSDLPTIALLQAMQTDKKKSAGKLNFILPKKIGEAFITDDVPADLVVQVMAELQGKNIR